jgi:hypothetical protein
VLQLHLIIRSPRQIGSSVVLIFGGGRTAVVLVVCGIFAGAISCNHYENHVELCHIFSLSTYAFDSVEYFRRYRILNSARLLSKN